MADNMLLLSLYSRGGFKNAYTKPADYELSRMQKAKLEVLENSDLPFQRLCGDLRLKLKGLFKNLQLPTREPPGDAILPYSETEVCDGTSFKKIPSKKVDTQGSDVLLVDFHLGYQLVNITENDVVIKMRFAMNLQVFDPEGTLLISNARTTDMREWKLFVSKNEVHIVTDEKINERAVVRELNALFDEAVLYYNQKINEKALKN